MTDITELAQLRGRTVDYPYYLVECDCGKIYPSSELSGGEPMGDSGDYSDCYCPHCGEGEEHFAECADPETAWKAQQDKIDALVEALEKAQQQIIALQQRHEVDPRTHEIIDLKERIDNLESFRTAYMEWGDKTDWMQTDKRFDFLKPWGKHRADVLKEYIQHLESRTVKLPPKVDSSNIPFAGHTWNCCLDEVEKRLAAAGIKVEADSLDADVNDRNQPGMVVAVHIDVGDFVKFRGQVYEVKETDFDDHDVTLWFVCGEVLKCAAGCLIEVVSAPGKDE